MLYKIDVFCIMKEAWFRYYQKVCCNRRGYKCLLFKNVCSSFWYEVAIKIRSYIEGYYVYPQNVIKAFWWRSIISVDYVGTKRNFYVKIVSIRSLLTISTCPTLWAKHGINTKKVIKQMCVHALINETLWWIALGWKVVVTEHAQMLMS